MIEHFHKATDHVCTCKNGCAVGGPCCGKCGSNHHKEPTAEPETKPTTPVTLLADLRGGKPSAGLGLGTGK